MSNKTLHDEDQDSDTSDEDYEPTTKPEDVPSEVDSDGDPEDALSDSEVLDNSNKRKRSSAPSKRPKLAKHKPTSDRTETEPPKLSEEDQKKKADDLWSDFMKDTGFQSRSATNSTPATKMPTEREATPISGTKPAEKVKITQTFEFAGEEVQVEKEVAADSAEARLLGGNKAKGEAGSKPGRSKAGLSGISSVLSQLGKKQKISVLEKTKLDWDKFKKDEDIEEELQTHNKGKYGYLERQDFLERADLRRFEIERQVRTVERNKRTN